jgi:hypothetical protein
MDPLAGFDDDEDADFFRSYDAEQASQALATHELGGAEASAPSPEQVAHSARFRKPVALFLGAMALLSLSALALRGAEPVIPAPKAHRELVAHYGAALPAATPVAVTATAGSSEAPATFVPVVWASVCAAPSLCLLDSTAVAAWLSIPSAQPARVEQSTFPPTHSNGRVRRPVHTSSMGSRGPVPSARFPEARP